MLASVGVLLAQEVNEKPEQELWNVAEILYVFACVFIHF